MFTVLVGFVLGALSIIVAQVVGLLLVYNRLFCKSKKHLSQSPPPHVDPLQSPAFVPNKQGPVWVLEPDKVPNRRSEDKVSKEQKGKREIWEVSPVKKNAAIKDHSLILTDSDGSQATINLLGCIVLAVSASDLSSRKWAKKYPIKVESSNSIVYDGSKSCYLYLDTSWEKESWCKALRLASCTDKEKVNWYYRLREEFHSYLTSLNVGHPLFMKPSAGLSSESSDKSSRLDASSSKVRLFLKKLAKKASKSGIEYKDSGNLSRVPDERKMGEKSHSTQDLLSLSGSEKMPTERITNKPSDEDTGPPLQSSITHSRSLRQIPVTSEADYDDKFGIDEGTFCWNLLTSRLFFDVKRSTKIKSSILARIQRTLSSMRLPSYIGGVKCIDIDIGSLPPYIQCMRALPMDMNEVWAVEIDIDYAGGAILDIETRLEIREPDFQKGMNDTNSESSSVGEAEAASGLLEGYLGEHLKLYGEVNDEISKSDGADKLNGTKSLKSSNWKSNYASRWKAIVSSMANQVSQVPLSLKIKIASVRGTMRLQIKPPPSDQLWFAFTSIPEIDFNLESSVGEHKITSGHVALLLGNRIKAAIRETLVLPNWECVCIPWMVAEKDDWVPRKVAPFMRISQEAGSDIKAPDTSSSQPVEAKPNLETSRSSKHLENRQQKTNNMAGIQRPINEPLEDSASSSQSGLSQYPDSQSVQDLKTPLLTSDEPIEINDSSRPESPDYQPSPEGSFRKLVSFGEDANPKRVWRRARMMDLGKKMGEKLEEKRRNIEERGRHIVEKMRGP